MSELITNLAIVPTENEILKAMNVLKTILPEDKKLPFWNIKTGEITFGYQGEESGVLIINQDMFDQNRISILRDPNWLDRWFRERVDNAIQNRLQAIADIIDFPDDFSYQKLASQINFSVFLTDELPDSILVSLLENLFNKELDESTRLENYEHFYLLMNFFDVERFEKIIKDVDSENMELIYVTVKNLISDPNSEKAKKILIMANHFVKNLPENLEGRVPTNIIMFMYYLVSYDAFDIGDGKNLMLLNQIKYELSNHAFVLDDNNFRYFVKEYPENEKITSLALQKIALLQNEILQQLRWDIDYYDRFFNEARLVNEYYNKIFIP